MAAAPALRVHVHLPIIEQTVVMTVPASVHAHRVELDPRIETTEPVDTALDHWTLWTLADAALGACDQVPGAGCWGGGVLNERPHRSDQDWLRLAERVALHESMRERHAHGGEWTMQRLHQAHAELGVLRGVGLRDVPAWFGGATPATARHFAPQPELVPGLVDDLLRFANLRPAWPFLQAVLAHYQLVMIHPFRDGNGRLSRLLALCLLERAQRPLAPLYAGFALQRWGHAYNDDALEDMTQGNVGAYSAWWARAHRFASMLVAVVDAERQLLSAQASNMLTPSSRIASALARAVMRSPCLTLPRFAEVHGLNAKRQQSLACALAEHGWQRIDVNLWLCVAALARLLEARNDLYVRQPQPRV